MTIDRDVSETKANDIHAKELIAYVLDDIAVQLQRSGKDWMKSLNELPTDLRKLLE